MDKNKSEHQFFAELLSDTEKQFKQSPVYQKQLKQGRFSQPSNLEYLPTTIFDYIILQQL